MKKGYTLLELLVTITILGFLIAMVAISAIHFYNDRNQKEYNNIVSIIVDSVKVLVNTDTQVITNMNDILTSEDDTCKIEYSDLVTKKLMDENTINPLTQKPFNTNSYVKVILLNDYNYQYTFVDADEEEIEDLPNCIN